MKVKVSEKIRQKYILHKLKKNNVNVVPADEHDERTITNYDLFRNDDDFHQFYDKNTFDNQKLFGKQIYESFLDLHLLTVFALAPTQSGKTGSMLSAINHFYNSKENHVPLQNCFIFTTHSSTEWLLQTRERFPACFSNNIFHRNQVKSFVKAVSGKKNCLIIFDESHIASKQFQTMFRIYNALGFYNSKFMYQNNIKIVHFTATPKQIISQANAIWKDTCKTLYMQVPKQYVSLDYYLKEGRISQAKDLRNLDNVLEIKDFIKDDTPAFHIIRTSRGKHHIETISHFKNAFSHIKATFISEPFNKSFNIDRDIYKKPEIHTFIFIIDKLRCAKTLNLQFVHILYERVSKKPDESSIIQGLAGRATGYHSHASHIHILSHIDSIQNHNFHDHIHENIQHNHFVL